MSALVEIWRLLDRRQQRQLLVLQLLSLLMAFSTLSGVAAVLPFFTVLVEPGVVHRSMALSLIYEHANFHDERTFVVVLGIVFVGIVFLANAINFFGTLAMNRFAYSVGNAFHVLLFDEYLHRDYSFHATTNSSSLSSNVLYEATRVAIGILQSGLLLVTNIVTIAVIVASIILLNPTVAIAALAGFGMTYVLLYALVRKRLLHYGAVESRFLAERTKIVNEGFGAVKEVIVTQAQDLFVGKFVRSCRAIAHAAVGTLAIAQSPKHLLEFLAVGGLVGVALFHGAKQGVDPSWLAQLTFVGFAAYRLLPALQQVFLAIVRIRVDSPALRGIAGDLRRARSNGSRRSGERIEPSWRGRPFHEIKLREVVFRYATDRSAALAGVTLRIPAGAMIGFIGSNGSGKTTAVDLILGLLMPESGHVEVDGIELNSDNGRSWQSTVACVPQQIFLLDATVAENIALGTSATEIDQEQVRKVARMARVDEFVKLLPNGYDELLGERGIRLGGGQRQRIGIARALYRAASLLVMDEPTSALDSLSEQELLVTLESLRGRCTVILIAHRPTTLRNCDLIFEFERGNLVGSGTYSHLLLQSEQLRRMVGLNA